MEEEGKRNRLSIFLNFFFNLNNGFYLNPLCDTYIFSFKIRTSQILLRILCLFTIHCVPNGSHKKTEISTLHVHGNKQFIREEKTVYIRVCTGTLSRMYTFNTKNLI